MGAIAQRDRRPDQQVTAHPHPAAAQTSAGPADHATNGSELRLGRPEVAPSVPAIEVRAATKRYGQITALDAVDLTVAPGGVHGLLGPNGAGKTTLLRVLLGLVGLDAGTVEVLGNSPANALARSAGIAGFVESPGFYPYLSALRNLDLLAALDGDGDGGEGVDTVLDAVGLRDVAKRKVGTFSTGMRQRLGIAAALLRRPSLLVLDEPTNGLDPAGVRELHAVITRAAGDGRTVLLSSHDMAEIEMLCDAVTILAGGRRVHSGTIAELRRLAPAPVHELTTSDDDGALAVCHALGIAATSTSAAAAGSARERVGDTPSGLRVHAVAEQLDRCVLALGADGIAVRRLVRTDSALEALFLRLTDPGPA